MIIFSRKFNSVSSVQKGLPFLVFLFSSDWRILCKENNENMSKCPYIHISPFVCPVRIGMIFLSMDEAIEKKVNIVWRLIDSVVLLRTDVEYRLNFLLYISFSCSLSSSDDDDDDKKKQMRDREREREHEHLFLSFFYLSL